MPRLWLQAVRKLPGRNVLGHWSHEAPSLSHLAIVVDCRSNNAGIFDHFQPNLHFLTSQAITLSLQVLPQIASALRPVFSEGAIERNAGRFNVIESLHAPHTGGPVQILRILLTDTQQEAQ